MLGIKQADGRWRRTLISASKLLPSDPVAQEAATEEIKKKYAQYFWI